MGRALREVARAGAGLVGGVIDGMQALVWGPVMLIVFLCALGLVLPKSWLEKPTSKKEDDGVCKVGAYAIGTDPAQGTSQAGNWCNVVIPDDLWMPIIENQVLTSSCTISGQPSMGTMKEVMNADGSVRERVCIAYVPNSMGYTLDKTYQKSKSWSNPDSVARRYLRDYVERAQGKKN